MICKLELPSPLAVTRIDPELITMISKDTRSISDQGLISILDQIPKNYIHKIQCSYINFLPGVLCSGEETLSVAAATLGTKSISFITLRGGILFHLFVTHAQIWSHHKLSSTFSVMLVLLGRHIDWRIAAVK